jgi:putative component of toxin-antitoxin plasmid stabilization module
MRQRGGAGRRDPHNQIRNRDRVDKVPGGRSPQISPVREGTSSLVHGEGHGHSEETLAVLQVPGAGARVRNVHVQCGSRASVLQLRQ